MLDEILERHRDRGLQVVYQISPHFDTNLPAVGRRSAATPIRQTPQVQQRRNQITTVELWRHTVTGKHNHVSFGPYLVDQPAQFHVHGLIDVSNRRRETVGNVRVICGVSRILKVPELMAGAMRFREGAKEEIPVLPPEQKSEQLAAPGDAGKEPIAQLQVLARRAPVVVAAVDRISTDGAQHVVHQPGWMRGSIAARGVRAPIGNLETVDARAQCRLWHVDDGRPPAGPRENVPEWLAPGFVLEQIELTGTRLRLDVVVLAQRRRVRAAIDRRPHLVGELGSRRFEGRRPRRRHEPMEVWHVPFGHKLPKEPWLRRIERQEEQSRRVHGRLLSGRATQARRPTVPRERSGGR